LRLDVDRLPQSPDPDSSKARAAWFDRFSGSMSTSPRRCGIDLDEAAQDLNVSRQAVIKTLVRQALDHHYLARSAKQSLPRS
jgi:hypothetical protein